MFDHTPSHNPKRDKAWADWVKRKDVKALMKGKEDFKFPLDGSYGIWCVAWSKAWDAAWSKAWDAGFKAAMKDKA